MTFGCGLTLDHAGELFGVYISGNTTGKSADEFFDSRCRLVGTAQRLGRLPGELSALSIFALDESLDAGKLSFRCRFERSSKTVRTGTRLNLEFVQLSENRGFNKLID